MLAPSNPKSTDNSNLDHKKMMPPPQQNSSSLTLAPPENLRVPHYSHLDRAVEHELKNGKLDPNMDEKKLRRMVSNRLSAQRSRMRTSEYIHHMEKMVKNLEEMISVLAAQVESYKENRKDLLLQYESLQKLVEIHTSEAKICGIEIEQKQLEICRLRELLRTLKKHGHDLGIHKKRKIGDSIN